MSKKSRARKAQEMSIARQQRKAARDERMARGDARIEAGLASPHGNGYAAKRIQQDRGERERFAQNPEVLAAIAMDERREQIAAVPSVSAGGEEFNIASLFEPITPRKGHDGEEPKSDDPPYFPGMF